MSLLPIIKNKKIMGGTIMRTTLTPIRNFLSQMNYFVALEATTYLTSIMELVVQDCFTLLQLIAPPP